MPGGFNINDEETAARERSRIAFSDQKVRNEFMRKVYTILMIQLGITFGGVLFCFLYEPTFIFFRELNSMWMILIFALMIITACPLLCSRELARNSPLNFILLMIFTCITTVMLCKVVVHYSLNVVIMALGLTTVVFLGLTLFACITTIDCTKCMVFMGISFLFLIVLGIVFMFFPSRVFEVVIAYIGVAVISFHIVFVTQAMMGGDHRYIISPEDYIFAVINLYLDFVNLFQYILILLDSD